MSNEPRAPRLAVLIDADNASSRIATRLFEEIAKIVHEAGALLLVITPVLSRIMGLKKA